jgi:peroxiredoxin
VADEEQVAHGLLDCLDTPDGAVVQVSLADSRGATRLLNVINSIDTPVCHVESRRWESLLAGLGTAVRVYTIADQVREPDYDAAVTAIGSA